MDKLVERLVEMDASILKGPWVVADGGGIERDRFGRERPNPKPFVAEAHNAEPDSLCVARAFERAKRPEAFALVSLRNALPALVEYVKAAQAFRLWLEEGATTLEVARARYDAARAALLSALGGDQ